MSDTSLEELHKFAGKLGFSRLWFQDNPLHPHYDLTTERAKRRALAAGAQEVTGKELARRCSALFKS